MAAGSEKIGLSAAVHAIAHELSQTEADAGRRAELYATLVTAVRDAVAPVVASSAEKHVERARLFIEAVALLTLPADVPASIASDFRDRLGALIDDVTDGGVRLQPIEAPEVPPPPAAPAPAATLAGALAEEDRGEDTIVSPGMAMQVAMNQGGRVQTSGTLRPAPAAAPPRPRVSLARPADHMVPPVAPARAPAPVPPPPRPAALAPETIAKPDSLQIDEAVKFDKNGEPVITGRIVGLNPLLHRVFMGVKPSFAQYFVPVTRFAGKARRGTFKVTAPRKDATYLFAVCTIVGRDPVSNILEKKIEIPAPKEPQIDEQVVLKGKEARIAGVIPDFEPHDHVLWAVEKGADNWQEMRVGKGGRFTVDAPRKNSTWVFCVKDKMANKQSPFVEKTVEIPPPPDPEIDDEIQVGHNTLGFTGRVPGFDPEFHMLWIELLDSELTFQPVTVNADGSFTVYFPRPEGRHHNLEFGFVVTDGNKQESERVFREGINIEIQDEPEVLEINPPKLSTPTVTTEGQVRIEGSIPGPLNEEEEVWLWHQEGKKWELGGFDARGSFVFIVHGLGTYEVVRRGARGGVSPAAIALVVTPEEALKTIPKPPKPEIDRPDDLIIPGGVIPHGQQKLKITGKIPNYKPGQQVFCRDEVKEWESGALPVKDDGSFEFEVDLIGRYQFYVAVKVPAGICKSDPVPAVVKGRPDHIDSKESPPPAPIVKRENKNGETHFRFDIPEPREGKVLVVISPIGLMPYCFLGKDLRPSVSSVGGVVLEKSDGSYLVKVVTVVDQQGQTLQFPLVGPSVRVS